MTAMETLQRCRELGINLSVRDGLVVSHAPPGQRISTDLRIQIAEHSATFVKLLAIAPRSDWPSADEACGNSAVSFAERSLWRLAQADPTEPAYNICFDLTITGDITLERLENCIGELLGRHEAFRTHFQWCDNELRRCVTQCVDIPVSRLDLIGLDKASQSKRIAERRDFEATTTFRLDRLPLIRITLVRLARRHYQLIVGMHHIICDGWSLRVLIDELCLLSSIAIRNPSHLPQPWQLRHFVKSQSDFLMTAEAERQLEYWRTTLSGSRLVPFSVAVNRFADRQCASYELVLAPHLAEAASNIARAYGATPFAMLFAVICLAFWNRTQSREILVGVDFANRDAIESQGIIGMLANQLPLCIRIEGDHPFPRFLEHVRTQLECAQANSRIPFERVVENHNRSRPHRCFPIITTKIVDRGLLLSAVSNNYCTIEPCVRHPAGVKYELTVFVQRGTTTTIVYEYDVGVIAETAIADSASTVSGILTRLSLCPAVKLNEAAPRFAPNSLPPAKYP